MWEGKGTKNEKKARKHVKNKENFSFDKVIF